MKLMGTFQILTWLGSWSKQKIPRTKGKNEDGDEVDTGQNELFEADSPRLVRGEKNQKPYFFIR